MPIYEYKCRECGSHFERLVRSAEVAGIKCPQCGSEQTEKKVSVFATSGAAPAGSAPMSGSDCGGGGGFS